MFENFGFGVRGQESVCVLDKHEKYQAGVLTLGAMPCVQLKLIAHDVH